MNLAVLADMVVWPLLVVGGMVIIVGIAMAVGVALGGLWLVWRIRAKSASRIERPAGREVESS